MKNWLRRFGQIYEGEGWKVLWFACLGALLQAGVGIGYVSADSMFISYLGVETLPYVFFILPFVMIVVTPAVSLITQRLSALSMQLGASVVLTAGGAGLFFLNGLALERGEDYLWIFFGIKLYSAVCYITVYTIYWNFVDAYFDILSAKRLFPLLGASCTIGSLLGGYVVTVCMDQGVPVGYLFVIWAGLAFLSLLPALQLLRFKTLVQFDDVEEEGLSGQLANLKKGFFKSRYALLLAASSFLVMTLAPLCEFQYMHVFQDVYADEQSLADLLGSLFMAANVFNTFVVLFLFNRMVVNFGVRNVALIQPAVYLVAFIGFISVYGSDDSMFWAAVFGFFAFQGFHTSIEYNNFNLIINPIPRGVKASIRTLIEGWAEPFGSAVAGLILIGLMDFADFSALGIAVAAALLCLVYLVSILLLRSDYAGATINTLRSEWIDFSREEKDVHSGLSKQELDDLIRHAESERLDECLAACRILWHNDRATAVSSILARWEEAGIEEKTACSRLLGEMFESNDNDVNRLILDWLILQDDGSRQTFVSLLNQHTLVSANTLVEMARSADPATRASASGLLWRHWDADNSLLAAQTFHSLMEGDRQDRQAAIQLLANTSESRFAQYVQTYLNDEDPALRRIANMALVRLAGPQNRNLVVDVIRLLNDESHEARLAVFEAIERIGDSSGIPLMLESAEQFSPYQRRLAQQAILRIGLKSVPTCMSVLKDEGYPYAGRSIAARALALMAFPQLDAALPGLVEREIHNAYEMISIYQTLIENQSHTAGFECLEWFYKDEQMRSLGFVLELLSLSGRLPNHEMIIASLSSNNQATRSNAIETLEQSIPGRSFRHLLPLVDGRSPEEQVKAYRRRVQASAKSVNEIIQRAWRSENPLEKSIAAQIRFESAFSASESLLQSSLESLGSQLDDSHSRVRDTILSLMRKLDEPATETLIDRLVCFKRIALFQPVLLGDLVGMAERAEAVSVSAGDALYQKGDNADGFFIIRSGAIELSGVESGRIEAVALLGDEALGADGFRLNDAVAIEAASGYRLSNAALDEFSSLYPSLAVQRVGVRVKEACR